MKTNTEIIKELEDFKNDVKYYFDNKYNRHGKNTDEVRAKIAKIGHRINKYLEDVNVSTKLHGYAPPAMGGFPYTWNIIEGMFINEGGPLGVQAKYVYDALNKAIGRLETNEIPNDSTEREHTVYINNSRIDELNGLQKTQHDLTKLIQILKELNICFSKKCYISVIILTRALIDHVPPIFNVKTFGEVANNYDGKKSFKSSMQHLDISSRKIADQYLHVQIRSKEVLPNETQVNFSNDIDVLLGEIVRILK